MIKLFTHNDLDGLCCVLLAQLAYGVDQVDFETCHYDSINDKLQTYLAEKTFAEYEACFITDISMNGETAWQIDQLIHDNADVTFCLLDHHLSAMPLNAYSWGHVTTGNEAGIPACGTSLFYDYIRQNLFPCPPVFSSRFLSEFVEKVRRYDTWDWAALDDSSSKQLNDLFYILGKERFICYWFQRLNSHPDEGFSFDPSHLLLLELKQNEIDKFIESRNEELVVREIAGYQAGIVFASRFQSELGNALAQLHPELDLIAMINVGGGVSFRTAKDEINLAEVAALFGGGGHAKAAGLPVPDEVRELVIDTLFHVSENFI